MDLLSAPPKVHDRRLNVLLVASVVTAVVLVIFAAVAVPKILSNASTTDALKRNQEIGGCRATYRAKVDKATAGVLVAKSKLDEATNAGFDAAVSRDPETLAAVRKTFAPLRKALDEAVKELDEANEANAAAVALSIEDPGAFVASCTTDQESPT